MKRFIKQIIIATLLPFHAAARATGLVRPGVAVLMYHSIGEHEWEFSVPPASFERHLDLLADRGFHFINLYRLERMLIDGAPVPDRSVVVTFDDGYRDILDSAIPMLAQRNIRPLLYIHTSRQGYPLGNRLPLLSWQEIRSLKGLVDVGNHSHTHPMMKTLSQEQLRDEIRLSSDLFRHEIGYVPRTFAYPGGKFNERVIDALRSHGFTTAFTIDHGLVRPRDEVFRLHRIGVTSHMSDGELYAHAIGVGEWYGRLVRRIKSLFPLSC